MTDAKHGGDVAGFTPRAELQRQILVDQIARMLDELGNPPLVDRIFPNGWRDADDTKLAQLYDLCGRTYRMRGQS